MLPLQTIEHSLTTKPWWCIHPDFLLEKILWEASLLDTGVFIRKRSSARWFHIWYLSYFVDNAILNHAKGSIDGKMNVLQSDI